MRSITKQNKKGTSAIVITAMIIIIAVAITLLAVYVVVPYTQGKFSIGGGSDGFAATGQSVKITVQSKNFYNGSALAPTVSLYEQKPNSCWNQPTETSCTETATTSTVAAAGLATFTDTLGGKKYFGIQRLSGYYPEYFEVTVPVNFDSATDLAQYNTGNGQITLVPMKAIETLTVSNQTFTVSTTENNKEYLKTLSMPVTNDKCLRLWKMSVTEVNNSLSDSGNGVSYEGIKTLKIAVNGREYNTIVSLPATANSYTAGVSNEKVYALFANPSSSNDDWKGLEICDNANVELKFDLIANINSSVSLTGNDNMFQDNETVARVNFFDVAGTSTGTIKVMGSTSAQ